MKKIEDAKLLISYIISRKLMGRLYKYLFDAQLQ
jgi:hypothetical protein